MQPESSNHFENLAIYQIALQFVMAMYGLIAIMPKNDVYGLAGLMKQAAIGITTNIGSSSKKKNPGDQARYLNLALESLEECRYYLNFVEEVGYARTSDLKHHLSQVRTLLEEHASWTTN
jgi:four helix bundle protein